jgi:hypothetical protein
MGLEDGGKLGDLTWGGDTNQRQTIAEGVGTLGKGIQAKGIIYAKA